MHVIRNEIILFRIVKSALEIVERGLSVLGLATMPALSLSSPRENSKISCGDFSASEDPPGSENLIKRMQF